MTKSNFFLVESPGAENALVNQTLSDLYRDEAPRLLRFFRRRLGRTEDAQDLTQETLLRYLRIGPTDWIDTPRAYLTRIATNLLRDRADLGATKLSQATLPLIEGIDQRDASDPYREIAARQELREWLAILDQLKPRTLEIFLLSRVDGFTYKEIASRLGMTVWNVKKHMMKAIAHIDRYRSL